MQFLLIHLLGFLSFTTPLSSCNRHEGDPPANIYTVSQHGQDRDSVNATLTGSRRNAITVAVAKASPAVVGINVTAVQTIQYQEWDPFGMFNDPFMRQLMPNMGGTRTRKFPVKALGSGFIISSDGYILTNDHVAGKATKIIVTTTSGSEYDAKLVGTDPNSDISLLKIEGKDFPFLKLGNSGELAVGEWAIAMGNPFGLFSINDKPTVTVGVVSNTGVNYGYFDGHNYRDMIQTDAAISSGNSGGPLLDANGEVIGMNAIIHSTAQSNEGAGSIGLGFAIPINKIKSVVDRLRTGEKVDHNITDLGMGFVDISQLSDEDKESLKITNEIGVVVQRIFRNSPGDRAGILPGDVILSLDNEKVRSTTAFESALADHEVGDKVTFHILRNGKNVDVSMKLAGK